MTRLAPETYSSILRAIEQVSDPPTRRVLTDLLMALRQIDTHTTATESHRQGVRSALLKFDAAKNR